MIPIAKIIKFYHKNALNFTKDDYDVYLSVFLLSYDFH